MSSPQEVVAFCKLREEEYKSTAKRLGDRLRTTLNAKNLEVEVIPFRVKEADSVTQKLHTGEYSSISEIDDMIGLTVVVSHLSEVPKAINAVRSSTGFVVSEDDRPRDSSLKPEDFRYHEPKMYVSLKNKHPDNEQDFGTYCEVQFTTTLQYALNKATHDFAYKSRDVNLWSNSRLVAQMRGMLELVDQIIDDLESTPLPEPITSIGRHEDRAKISELIVSQFDEDEIKDLRRATITTEKWLRQAGKKLNDLQNAFEKHSNILRKKSLDPMSAILGVMISEFGVGWVNKSKKCMYLITGDLLSLVPEVEGVELSKRIRVESYL